VNSSAYTESPTWLIRDEGALRRSRTGRILQWIDIPLTFDTVRLNSLTISDVFPPYSVLQLLIIDREPRQISTARSDLLRSAIDGATWE
jgi:hypothetical protein